MELLLFDGFDPIGWICGVETYFEVHDTFKELKDGSIKEYIEHLEILSPQVLHLHEEIYLVYFMGGLRLDT
ncbi:hypothetical protein CR513_56772, partial [Mucuna pruriens]